MRSMTMIIAFVLLCMTALVGGAAALAGSVNQSRATSALSEVSRSAPGRDGALRDLVPAPRSSKR